MVTPDATITANPFLSSKLSYNAQAFTPIIVLCRGTPVLVVNASVPAKSMQELIALAKAKPGSLNYGSYGIGTYAHLSMEDFKQRTGTDIVHIPFRGAAPAANALLADSVTMLLLNLSSIADHETTGKVRILAAAGGKRIASRPNLPTIAEAGVPGFPTSVLVSGCWARPTCRRIWWRRFTPTSPRRSMCRRVEGVLREEHVRACDA